MAGTPSLDRRGVFLENNASALLRPVQSASADLSQIKKASEDLDAKGKASYQALVHHGTISTLDIINIVRNLSANTNIVSFRVPNGQVAVITHLALVCDNPAVSMTNAMVWRLLVDNQELPHMNSSLLFGQTGYRTNVGNIHRPMAITPVVVQSNQLITIELRISILIVGCMIAFAGRLVGRLISQGAMTALPMGDLYAS